MQEDKKKSEANKEAAAANSKEKSQVAGTSGGEIPDPPKMPSKTKFHSDAADKKPVNK